VLNSNYNETIIAEKASKLYNAMTDVKKVQMDIKGSLLMKWV